MIFKVQVETIRVSSSTPDTHGIPQNLVFFQTIDRLWMATITFCFAQTCDWKWETASAITLTMKQLN